MVLKRVVVCGGGWGGGRLEGWWVEVGYGGGIKGWVLETGRRSPSISESLASRVIVGIVGTVRVSMFNA